MKILNLILFLLFFNSLYAQKAPIIKFKDLQEIMHRKTDTTYVINFWATWCDPCIRELPSFMQLEKEMTDKKVKFHFVSLDFVRDYDTQFLPFLEKQSMNNYVYLLDEPDYNSWIDKINPHWLGSIPTTIIISHHPDTTYFNEGELSYDVLSKILIPITH